MNDQFRLKKGKKIEGFKIENDVYSNIIAFQNYLYLEEYPLSLEKLDTIVNLNLGKDYNNISYTLILSDSLGKKIASINHGGKDILQKSGYKEKIQLRTITPEFIEIMVFSPYRIIFGKMFLLLAGSVCIALIVAYCLFLQIRIIIRQDRIAEIRRDFTNAMIHDMKSPLTAILMGVNALKSGKIDDKPRMKEQYYDIITNEGNHLLSITNKILTIAQFEEKKIALYKQSVDLSELIDHLKEKYLLNVSKEIRFQVDLNGVKSIYADYGYIYESFNNIIDNAVKYSKDKVNICISCFNWGKYIQIKFRDDGIGIPIRDQKKIFEKFERASSVKKEQKVNGFGLGLNYVYQVVTAHGGEIGIDSVPGEYSEFTINLPYDDKIIAD
ncbi:MAG: HAMP domain-containing histidine kinase [Dysgonamonadaceae bacterium]|nr:HAMP domain-containing histidine kinase [Dysgonamonadaceae bacterium]